MNKLFIQNNFEEMSHLKILENKSKSYDNNDTSLDFCEFISTPVSPLS